MIAYAIRAQTSPQYRNFQSGTSGFSSDLSEFRERQLNNIIADMEKLIATKLNKVLIVNLHFMCFDERAIKLI